MPTGLAGDLGPYVDDNPLLTYRRLPPALPCCSSELDSLSPILCPARLACALILCDDLCVDLGVISMSADATFERLGPTRGEARSAFFSCVLSSFGLVSLELVSREVSLASMPPDLETSCRLTLLLPARLKLCAPILTLEPLVTLNELSLDKTATACCSDKIILLRGYRRIAPFWVCIS